MTLLAALGYSVSRNIAHCLHGSQPLCTGRLRDEVFSEVDVEAARIGFGSWLRPSGGAVPWARPPFISLTGGPHPYSVSCENLHASPYEQAPF
jgi:hypothetical protein